MKSLNILEFIDRFGEYENPEYYTMLRKKYYIFPIISGFIIPLHNRFLKICYLILQLLRWCGIVIFLIMLAIAAIKIRDYSFLLACYNTVIIVTICIGFFANMNMIIKRDTFYLCNWMCLNKPLFDYKQHIKSEIKQRINWDLTLFEYIVHIPIIFYIITCMIIIFANPISYEINANAVEDVHFYSGVPLWYPYDVSTNNIVNNIFYYCFTLIIGFNCWSDVSMGLLTYHYTVSKWIEEQYLLVQSIVYMKERSMEHYEEIYGKNTIWKSEIQMYKDKNFSTCYLQCLIENVKHHQILIRYKDVCTELLQIPILFNIILISVNIAVGGFVIASEEKLIIVICIILIISIHSTLQIYIIMLYGQKIENLGQELIEAIYGLQWYYCNKEIRNVIKIMQLFASKPLVLRAKIIPVNLNAFANVLKSAYSYYSLLTPSAPDIL